MLLYIYDGGGVACLDLLLHRHQKYRPETRRGTIRSNSLLIVKFYQCEP